MIPRDRHRLGRRERVKMNTRAENEKKFGHWDELPGYVAPQSQLSKAFQSIGELQQNFHFAVQLREHLWAGKE